MTGKADVRDFETVNGLIRAEIEEGLAAFRTGDSEARLRARIARGNGPVRRRPVPAKVAVPALLSAAAGAVALIVITRPPATPPIDPGQIAAVLLRVPSLSQPPAEALRPPSRASLIAEGQSGFEKALAAAGRLKKEEKGGLLGQAGRLEAPAYSRRERMRVLYRDKVIERALMMLINRSKEA